MNTEKELYCEGCKHFFKITRNNLNDIFGCTYPNPNLIFEDIRHEIGNAIFDIIDCNKYTNKD